MCLSKLALIDLYWCHLLFLPTFLIFYKLDFVTNIAIYKVQGCCFPVLAELVTNNHIFCCILGSNDDVQCLILLFSAMKDDSIRELSPSKAKPMNGACVPLLILYKR